MSTLSLPLSEPLSGRLRPLNIMRDLPAVADLVELCFRTTMDDDGRRYIQQMRNASHDNRFLRWAATSLEQTSMPLSGYVWEENKKIVGNISLVPFTRHNQRIYLLSNIAVHPDYRRRGIAQRLTRNGINHARKRRAGGIWLHVRAENEAAIRLYRKLGFNAHSTRVTWRAPLLPVPETESDLAAITVMRRAKRHWRSQQQWLQRSYPSEIAWYRMPNWDVFGVGWQYWLNRILMENDVRQWAVERGGRLQGVTSWMQTRARTTPLWLASAPQADEAAIGQLLLHTRRQLSRQRRELSLDFPAGQMTAALETAGFHAHQTLLWMYYDQSA